jgi:D-alanine-D-alanine ligase
MSKGLRVGLLFGGRSLEHEVSLISARGVASAMRETSLELVPLAVTGEGRWLPPEVSTEILESDVARVECDDDDGVRLVLDPGGGGLLRTAPGGSVEPVALDVLFPLIHGWGGEDGRIQGALELAAVPYVGADVLGSAAGMDKAMAKRVFASRGLPQLPWLEYDRGSYERDPKGARDRVVAELGLPAFVKPANGGSSVGISRVSEAGRLAAAFEEAWLHDRKVVVEQGIDAREIECAVLGNEEPQASGLGEIVPSREFYDYAAKYLDGTSELIIPAQLDLATAERIRAASLEAFRALDLKGLARVDFLLDRRDDRFFLNEVNTLPGFTPISMFPKLWETAGLAYPRLIERLVELARERWTAERRLRTRLHP